MNGEPFITHYYNNNAYVFRSLAHVHCFNIITSVNLICRILNYIINIISSYAREFDGIVFYIGYCLLFIIEFFQIRIGFLLTC